MLAQYRKAIAAFLTALVGLIAIAVPAVAAYLTPELIASFSMIAGTAVVYAIPNASPPAADTTGDTAADVEGAADA